MVIRRTDSCCAISEIAKLSVHKTPTAAMEAFCKFYQGLKTSATLRLGDVTDYYLFSGVVRELGTKEVHDSTVGLVENVRYGPEFADFIVKYKLGTIEQCPQRVNTNHPSHIVQAWVWCPDREALKVWWTTRFEGGQLTQE